MKVNQTSNRNAKEHLTGAIPPSTLTTEECTQKRQQDKEFITTMNEFISKAGLLSDDPYFGGI